MGIFSQQLLAHSLAAADGAVQWAWTTGIVLAAVGGLAVIFGSANLIAGVGENEERVRNRASRWWWFARRPVLVGGIFASAGLAVLIAGIVLGSIDEDSRRRAAERAERAACEELLDGYEAQQAAAGKPISTARPLLGVFDAPDVPLAAELAAAVEASGCGEDALREQIAVRDGLRRQQAKVDALDLSSALTALRAALDGADAGGGP